MERLDRAVFQQENRLVHREEVADFESDVGARLFGFNSLVNRDAESAAVQIRSDIGPEIAVKFIFVGANDVEPVLSSDAFDHLDDLRKWLGLGEPDHEKTKFLRIGIFRTQPIERQRDFGWMGRGER